VHRKAACLRCFYRHLRREGLLDGDPTATLAPPRRGRKRPQVLSRGEVERLLAVPAGGAPAALRDRALLELLYACGLRASEVALRLGDVDLDGRVLRARGKGARERVVPIGGPAWLWRGPTRCGWGDVLPAAQACRSLQATQPEWAG
jgi:integrase/recombinase XerD